MLEDSGPAQPHDNAVLNLVCMFCHKWQLSSTHKWCLDIDSRRSGKKRALDGLFSLHSQSAEWGSYIHCLLSTFVIWVRLERWMVWCFVWDSPISLWYLNWFEYPNLAAWGGLGCATLLEEVCHLGTELWGFRRLHPFSSLYCLWLESWLLL